jgi:hypothetical protein
MTRDESEIRDELSEQFHADMELLHKAKCFKAWAHLNGCLDLWMARTACAFMWHEYALAVMMNDLECRFYMKHIRYGHGNLSFMDIFRGGLATGMLVGYASNAKIWDDLELTTYHRNGTRH